ncbi:unnamed protein product [Caenorhabditis nigoni]
MDMEFHTNLNDATTTIKNNLPDPKLVLQNPGVGSNVFDVIEKFFSNTQAPVCGSIILILLKRYPDEADTSRLVSLIRSHHAIVHVVTSAYPAGGYYPKTMLSVASKTNGMGPIEPDRYFWEFFEKPLDAACGTTNWSFRDTLNRPAELDEIVAICVDFRTFPLCTQRANATYMLAYSNDIDSESVRKLIEVIDYFKDERDTRFVKFANVRFDLSQPEEIEFHDDVSDWISSMNKTLPDPRLSYSNNQTGSDMFTIIEKFLNNTHAPICGSRINILAKRLPTEISAKEIVNKLRHYHVYVYFTISENSYGGNTMVDINEIAFQTNGMPLIIRDSEFEHAAQVTPFYLKGSYIYKFPISTGYQNANLTWTNIKTGKSYPFEYGEYQFQNNFQCSPSPETEEGIYYMQLRFSYSSPDPEKVFVTIETYEPAPPMSNWVPYY